MSDPYERVKGGRLTFKGGALAARKSIDKKNKKHKKSKEKIDAADGSHPSTVDGEASVPNGAAADGGDIYTIDAAKKMKYEELFPVEAKKFGYVPKTNFKSVEDALDDRVKKKADRYCK